MNFDHRYLVVGDLHGDWRGLKRLLERVVYAPAADRVIFVGDYNDHFPDTDGSVRLLITGLIEMHRRAPENTFFIRGNHDFWFAQWLLDGGKPERNWYEQGGRETLRSYGIVNESAVAIDTQDFPPAHREFICQQVRPYYLDNHVVVVHGGFANENQMARVAQRKALHRSALQDLLWDRQFIFSVDDQFHLWYHQYFGNRYLITGHTPKGPYVNPRNPKWILVDSPGRGRHLCAVIIEDDQTYRFVCAE